MLRVVFALVLLGWIGSVHAYLITADNFDLEYSPDRYADLQGLEWLSLDETAGLSRTDIENGYGGLFDDGWEYASRAQTEILINSLWGGIYDGWSTDNTPGAIWFLNTFGTLAVQTLDFYDYGISGFWFGQQGECNTNITYTCRGHVVVAYDSFQYPDLDTYNVLTGQTDIAVSAEESAGYFYDAKGGNFGRTTYNESYRTSLQSPSTGSLLVRASVTIPEPPAMALMGLGLLGLFGVSRRIK